MNLKESAKELNYLQENQKGETLQVTSENGTVVLITDPTDIKSFLAGEEVYGEDQDGGSVEVSINNALDHQMIEGSCGYAPDGEVDVNNTDRMTPAGPDLIGKIREVIKAEIKKHLTK
jgi:hypothetical protein